MEQEQERKAQTLRQGCLGACEAETANMGGGMNKAAKRCLFLQKEKQINKQKPTTMRQGGHQIVLPH